MRETQILEVNLNRVKISKIYGPDYLSWISLTLLLGFLDDVFHLNWTHSHLKGIEVRFVSLRCKLQINFRFGSRHLLGLLDRVKTSISVLKIGGFGICSNRRCKFSLILR